MESDKNTSRKRSCLLVCIVIWNKIIGVTIPAASAAGAAPPAAPALTPPTGMLANLPRPKR